MSLLVRMERRRRRVRAEIQKIERSMPTSSDKKRSSKKKELSELSKAELLKLKKLYKGKNIFQVPQLSAANPMSPLILKILMQNIQILIKGLDSIDRTNIEEIFDDRGELTDDFEMFLIDITDLNKKNFGAIKKRLRQEIKLLLNAEIKNIERTIQKTEFDLSLLNKIEALQNETQKRIVFHIASKSEEICTQLKIEHDADEASIVKIITELKPILPVRELMHELSPTSTLFDQGIVEIEDEEIESVRKWEDMPVTLNKFVQNENLTKIFQDTHYKWNTIYRPQKKLSDVVIPEKEKKTIQSLIQSFQKKNHDQKLIFVFQGPPGTGKTMTSEAVASELGLEIMRIQAGEMEAKNIPNLISFAIARAKNSKYMLLFEECENILWESMYFGTASPWMKVLFENFQGVACFTSNYDVPTDFLRRATCLIKFKNPTIEAFSLILKQEIEQVLCTGNIQTDLNIETINSLSMNYRIPGGFFSQVLQIAEATSSDNVIRRENLQEAFKLVEGQLVDARTKHGPREPQHTLQNVQLENQNAVTMQKFTEYCKNVDSGSFILSENMKPSRTILFSGPPGTGKTMAAEGIAKALGKRIHKLTPGMLLGSYVGETEKNIHRAFSEAKAQDYVLFIDEAEGLLLNRESSRTSWERSQTDEFLQQIENFTGVLIAATNMTEFIDPAFSRRFIFHVKFEVPSKETRLLIWRNLGAPLAHLFDFSVVAEKYELSGGEIKNVILKAMAYGISTLSELENICETQMNERTGEANKVIGIS